MIQSNVSPINEFKPVYQYDYESLINCLTQVRADWSVCFKRNYYCESDLNDIKANVSFLKVNHLRVTSMLGADVGDEMCWC